MKGAAQGQGQGQADSLTPRKVLEEGDGLWLRGDEDEVRVNLFRLLRPKGPDERSQEQVLLLVHTNGDSDMRTPSSVATDASCQ
jgi:hypothetical protein